MSILIEQRTRVLVQGITGRSGALQSKVMLEYGTNIVAGVTPGKGGTSVHGIPVYDFVQEARQQHPFNVVVSFVPPAAAKDSCMEALDCGIDLLVLTSEGIPDHDVVDVIAYAESKGTRLIGPGAAGVIVPGKSKVGSHPPRFFTPGRVGIVSKSGALSYEIGKTLTDAGIGQSTVIAIGGGPFWGTTQRDAIQLFEADEETEVIVVLGEIGGSLEEEAAKYIASCVRKPVVALIVGHAAPPGKSLGHAGAIVSGDTGSAASKIAALQNAGVRVAATPSEVVTYVRELGG